MPHNKLKRSQQKLIAFFNKLGFLNKLTFTGREVLSNKIIGVDISQRKLLLVEENNNTYHSKIIDLGEVESCKVKKIYTAINTNNFKKNRIEEYLNSIALQFHFKNEKTPAALVFNRNKFHDMRVLKKLADKIKNWECRLSKILIHKEQKAA